MKSQAVEMLAKIMLSALPLQKLIRDAENAIEAVNTEPSKFNRVVLLNASKALHLKLSLESDLQDVTLKDFPEEWANHKAKVRAQAEAEKGGVEDAK